MNFTYEIFARHFIFQKLFTQKKTKALIEVLIEACYRLAILIGARQCQFYHIDCTYLRFCGKGMPCVMIVDSNATTGLFFSKASETSLCITVLAFHESVEYFVKVLTCRHPNRSWCCHMVDTTVKLRSECSVHYIYIIIISLLYLKLKRKHYHFV